MREPDTDLNERGSCASGLCVCVCVREKVVEGVIGGHQASLPPLPKQGCCVIVPGFPVTGLMRTCYCIMFFALIHCNH